MSLVTKAVAFSDGEVAYLSWQIKGMIPGCLGFEITRIYINDNTKVVLPSWVAFKGQSNKDWLPQTTSVWPVQKLSWRDLTVRKKTDQASRTSAGDAVKYLIRPVGQAGSAAGAVPVPANSPAYSGTPIKLKYIDEGATTDPISINNMFGKYIRATFTNGILSTQWLSHTLGGVSKNALMADIKQQGNTVREYLAGDVLDTLKELLIETKANVGDRLRMAIYELDDQELLAGILDVHSQVEIILSNTSANAAKEWDGENTDARKQLHAKLPKGAIMDRMFNNAHIGHNKFAIYYKDNKPTKVMTGSTNWTPNGLCAQSNNAVIIESPELAQRYDDYWNLLKTDTKNFEAPDPLSAAASNVQGGPIRSADSKPKAPVKLPDGTQITAWFSPNTASGTVNKTKLPPDLSQVYSIMRKAQKSIFFAVFLPGTSNDLTGDVMTNIISEAITVGQQDDSLVVYGSISSGMAMPNYVKGSKDNVPVYDENNVHIAQATALNANDLVGDFEAELLSAGNAIIHDKIVVVDPFTPDGKVIFGSHNLGFKASYGNDENLLIIENNPALVNAYAVHVLDIYEHYRFRAIQKELHGEGKQGFDGFLSLDDAWLKTALSQEGKSDLSRLMCG